MAQRVQIDLMILDQLVEIKSTYANQLEELANEILLQQVVALRKVKEQLKSMVDEDEELLATVMARLMRNKKILRQAEGRAARKAECLASEMDAEGAFEAEENCPAAAATVGLTPLMMETLGNMDQSLSFSGGTGVATSGN